MHISADCISFDDGHGLINYIETTAKCRHLKKWTCKGTLRQVFICLRPPPLLGFCLGWSSKFVGSESCQIQSVKLLQNIVSKRTQPPPPPPTTLSVLWHREGGGGELNQREGYKGQQFTMLGRNYRHDWLYLQSINSDTHLPQSPFTGKFFYMMTFCSGIYIVWGAHVNWEPDARSIKVFFFYTT